MISDPKSGTTSMSISRTLWCSVCILIVREVARYQCQKLGQDFVQFAHRTTKLLCVRIRTVLDCPFLIAIMEVVVWQKIT